MEILKVIDRADRRLGSLFSPSFYAVMVRANGRITERVIHGDHIPDRILDKWHRNKQFPEKVIDWKREGF